MMIKNFLLSLMVVLMFGSVNVSAQVSTQDSIERIAKVDARKFQLNANDFKIFTKDRSRSHSDFFKPTAENTKHLSLLDDSVYVKTFRTHAYRKTSRRHTVGHYFLIGGISVAGAVAVIMIAVSSQPVFK